MANITITQKSLLMDTERFEQAQRVGHMMALSPLFPEHLRKGGQSVALANAVLVQDMADRLSRPPLEVAQNIYFVSGKPGWSTSYLIGLANESGKLKESINWEVKGKGDTLEVRAFAKLKTGAKIEYTVSMEMAKAEGWTRNPKYKSLPELMLRYRSATALIRLYLPEITMGVPAQEEVLDDPVMRDITPQQTSQAPEAADNLVADSETKAEAKPKADDEPKEKPKVKEPEIEDAEVMSDNPEPETPEGEAKETPHNPDTGEVIEGEEAKEEPSEEDIDRHMQLCDMIVSEIEACDDLEMLEGVLDMYDVQIQQLKDFDASLAEKISAEADKRRESLKK